MMQVRNLLAISLLAITSASVQAHPASAEKDQFVLVRLKDRKPVPNQHLVIFVGATVQEARSHSIRIEADTDSNGVAALLLGPKMLWFQLWHEVGKTCPHGQGLDKDVVLHSSVLFDEGALVSGTCGAGLERLQPYLPNPPRVVHVPAKSD
jgi:hypothetical protein